MQLGVQRGEGRESERGGGGEGGVVKTWKLATWTAAL